MTLTVVSDPPSGGEITCLPSSTDGRYYPSDNVTLTAVAKHDYVFVRWTGDVSEVEDPTEDTIVIQMDRYYSAGTRLVEITAEFAQTGSSGLPMWSWAVIGIAAVLAMGMVTLLIRRRLARKKQAKTSTSSVS